MVKKIPIVLLILLIYLGSCYVGKKSPYGLPRRKINRFDSLMVSYENIDTLALYKSYIDFQYNPYLRNYSYYQLVDSHYYPYVSYLKFYPKGKLGLFIIAKKDTVNLKRSFFEPTKAKMGYYESNANGFVKTRISVMGDGGLIISNEKGFISNDTLKLEDNNNRGTIYIRKKVSKELLENWNPDW